MKERNLNRALTIRDPKAARLLVTSPIIALLEQIGEGRLTAREISERAGVPIKQAWYRLRQLESCGLVKRDGERLRAGRPQPLYRLTALRFIVPAEFRHATLGESLTVNLREALERADATLGEEFIWMDGRFRVEKLVDPDAVHLPVLELWMRTALDRATAETMMEELHALLDRYRRPAGPKDQAYLISVAGAPIAND